MPASEPVYLYIVTHTTRHLDVVLAGLSRQTRPPDHIVVSCDVDDPAIGDVIERWAKRCPSPLWWVRRAHHGVARCSQVRNNAVRCIAGDIGATEGRIIQIDGDILAPPEFVERHAALGEGRFLLYPHRVDVGAEQRAELEAERVYRGEQMPRIGAEQRARLIRRARRYRRHLLLRRLGLAPGHKPKLLGCNWSAPLSIWRDLNGFDEHFQGWGFLDDEFARRAAAAGYPCRVPVREIPAFHLHHATRQPEGPMSSNPNYVRFKRRDLPVRAADGLDSPIPQHPVEATRFEGAGAVVSAAESGV